MPWNVKENEGQFCVYKKGESTPIKGGCHDTREEAMAQLRALYANYDGRKTYALTFAEDIFEATEDENVKWLKAWRYSTWDHPKYGTVDVTPDLGMRFKQHFQDRVLGREHLINFDHGKDPAKGGKAGGVILDIEPRDDGIYYKVRFTDSAMSEIRNGDWHYLSPEYDDWLNPETGEVFEDVPFDLALTNTPFFKGMPALNFSELDPDDPYAFAEWSTSYKNDLPDSSFLFIESGGDKDADGKTTPRSFRHLPVKDASGKIDEGHLRNAIARLEQSGTGKGWLSDSVRSSLLAKARNMLSGNPKGGKEAVDELLKKFAERLGVDVEEGDDEESILAKADDLNKTIAPLRKAREDGERSRTFREAFPDEYKEMQKLKESRIENDAKIFAEDYSRFTVRNGRDEWKSNFGFSAVVLEKIEEVHKKFSTRDATQEDLKELLDLIGDKGVVDYSEHGSSRTLEGKPRSEDPKVAFSEAVLEIQEKDNLEYEAAISLAATKYPELYDAYLKAVPRR